MWYGNRKNTCPDVSYEEDGNIFNVTEDDETILVADILNKVNYSDAENTNAQLKTRYIFYKMGIDGYHVTTESIPIGVYYLQYFVTDKDGCETYVIVPIEIKKSTSTPSILNYTSPTLSTCDRDCIINKMKTNSNLWHEYDGNPSMQATIHQQNIQLAKKLNEMGYNIEYNTSTGYYIDKDSGKVLYNVSTPFSTGTNNNESSSPSGSNNTGTGSVNDTGGYPVTGQNCNRMECHSNFGPSCSKAPNAWTC